MFTKTLEVFQVYKCVSKSSQLISIIILHNKYFTCVKNINIYAISKSVSVDRLSSIFVRVYIYIYLKKSDCSKKNITRRNPLFVLQIPFMCPVGSHIIKQMQQFRINVKQKTFFPATTSSSSHSQCLHQPVCLLIVGGKQSAC